MHFLFSSSSVSALISHSDIHESAPATTLAIRVQQQSVSPPAASRLLAVQHHHASESDKKSNYSSGKFEHEKRERAEFI
jgi:hypothetical protein